MANLLDASLCLFLRVCVPLIQALPMVWVARIGRGAGAAARRLDRRHARMTVRNLTAAFGEGKSSAEIQALAAEHFRRVGENYLCAVKTAAMTNDELASCLTCVVSEDAEREIQAVNGGSVIFAIGHFGNFELYARLGALFPHLRGVTTYRRLRPSKLNRLLLTLRRNADCAFFDRTTEFREVQRFLGRGGALLGLLADQNGGRNGLQIPFFGRSCSTSRAPLLLAKRYQCPIYTAICYREGLGRWRIEVEKRIELKRGGRTRSMDDLAAEMNSRFEEAVLRDIPNWFWVHNRWKR